MKLPELGRKVDFRITEEEYEILRICAYEKDMSVSRFVRALITACVAPSLLTTTQDMRQRRLAQIDAEQERRKQAR